MALAEFNLLIDQKDKAQKYAKDAKAKLNKLDKVNLIRADDLIDLTKKKDSKNDN